MRKVLKLRFLPGTELEISNMDEIRPPNMVAADVVVDWMRSDELKYSLKPSTVHKIALFSQPTPSPHRGESQHDIITQEASC